jgi:hypothetical protein
MKRYTVITGVLPIRKSPRLTSPVIGRMKRGDEFISTDEQAGWGITWAQHPHGWVCVKDRAGTYAQDALPPMPEVAGGNTQIEFILRQLETLKNDIELLMQIAGISSGRRE